MLIYALREISSNVIKETRTACCYEPSEIPTGHDAVQFEDLKSGGTFDGTTFTPASPDTPVVPAELQAVLDIDASAESGSLKKVIEFIQSQYN